VSRRLVLPNPVPGQSRNRSARRAKFARYIIDAAQGAGSSNSSKWAGESELIKEANGLVSMTMMNQKVLDALMESIEKKCVPIPIA
jgi:hypothetical protein